jgi:hypothetical protein
MQPHPDGINKVKRKKQQRFISLLGALLQDQKEPPVGAL